eukprot:SAG31_NODE_5248_length_2651_cov_1.748041_1_plen_379_part_00
MPPKAAAMRGSLGVGDRATAAAFYCPGPVLASVAGMPAICLGCYAWTQLPMEARTKQMLLFSMLLSVMGYFGTITALPGISEKLKSKLYGVDLGKKFFGGANAGVPIPEGCGIVSGAVFLSCLILTQVFYHGDKMLEYEAAMLTVCFAMMLGLADDVMDIKWKHKILLSVLAALPLVVSYKGPTSIIVPKAFRWIFAADPSCRGADCSLTTAGSATQALLRIFGGDVDSVSGGAILELNYGYHCYMVALVVFATMAINIYAGVNGLEAGQSYVIACGILTMNVIEIILRLDRADCLENKECADMMANNLFSIMLMAPFAATTLGLLRFNWFPARVFVGDSFPYYAGMTIATAAILGHFSKSVMLLMIPQVCIAKAYLS